MRTSEDKVHRKDKCWSVRAVYILVKLPDISRPSLGEVGRYRNQPVRKKGKHFKGKADHLTKPRNRTGEDVLDMVNDVKVVFGKGHGSQPVSNDANGHAPMWKRSAARST